MTGPIDAITDAFIQFCDSYPRIAIGVGIVIMIFVCISIAAHVVGYRDSKKNEEGNDYIYDFSFGTGNIIINHSYLWAVTVALSGIAGIIGGCSIIWGINSKNAKNDNDE